MMNLTLVPAIIVFLIVYVCVYALVDRVMRCIEYCTAVKYGKKEKQVNGPSDISK